jgi:hypothetical protein
VKARRFKNALIATVVAYLAMAAAFFAVGRCGVSDEIIGGTREHDLLLRGAEGGTRPTGSDQWISCG